MSASSTRRSRAQHRLRASAALLTFEGSWIHHLGLATACAYSVLVPMVFDPSSLVAFALPKAFVSHALGYLLAAEILACLLLWGRRIMPWSGLHVSVGVFALVYVLAALFAVDPSVALFGASDRMLGLATQATLIVLYFGVVLFVRTSRDLGIFATAVFAGAIPVLLYQAIQLLGIDPIHWTTTDRPTSTLGNATVAGQYLGVLAIAAAGVGLMAVGRYPARVVTLIFAGAGVLAVGSFLPSTRSVLPGLMAGSIVLGAAVAMRARSPRGRAVRGLALAAVVVALLGGATLGVFGARIQGAVRIAAGVASDPDERRALASRGIFYRVALAEVSSRPLLGAGPDNFTTLFAANRPAEAYSLLRSDAVETSPHSWIAKVATDCGLLGVGAFVALIALAAVAVARRFDPVNVIALSAVASFLATGVFTVNDIGTEWLLWASLGLIAGRDTPGRNASPGTGTALRPVLRSPWSRGMTFGLLLVGAVLAIASVNAWGASRAAERSRVLQARADLEGAVKSADEATRADPRRAEYWFALGRAFGNSSRFEQAARAFGRAVDAAPFNTTYRRNLALAFVGIAQSGDQGARDRARQEALYAAASDPNNPSAHFTVAFVLLATGDPAGAAAASERGFSLGNPQEPEPYVTAGRAYLALHRIDDADYVLRVGLSSLRATPERTLEIRLWRARVLASAGRFEEAKQELDFVLGADPKNDAARRLLDELAGR